jgi:hypothetical protein
MHRVKFVTKNIEENHPDFRLITDRSADFKNFQQAMAFIRNLRSGVSLREILIGTPEVEVA